MAHEPALALARKQIELSERSVEKQRCLLVELEGRGYATLMPKELLAVFEANLRAPRAEYTLLMMS